MSPRLESRVGSASFKRARNSLRAATAARSRSTLVGQLRGRFARSCRCGSCFTCRDCGALTFHPSGRLASSCRCRSRFACRDRGALTFHLGGRLARSCRCRCSFTGRGCRCRGCFTRYGCRCRRIFTGSGLSRCRRFTGRGCRCRGRNARRIVRRVGRGNRSCPLPFGCRVLRRGQHRSAACIFAGDDRLAREARRSFSFRAPVADQRRFGRRQLLIGRRESVGAESIGACGASDRDGVTSLYDLERIGLADIHRRDPRTGDARVVEALGERRDFRFGALHVIAHVVENHHRARYGHREMRLRRHDERELRRAVLGFELAFAALDSADHALIGSATVRGHGPEHVRGVRSERCRFRQILHFRRDLRVVVLVLDLRLALGGGRQRRPAKEADPTSDRLDSYTSRSGSARRSSQWLPSARHLARISASP